MNSCVAVGLDSLSIFNRLKKTGISDEHARIQTEVLCGQAEFCAAEIRQVIENYDAARRRESATGGDVQDVRLEVEKVRAELKADIEKVKYDLLKWMFGLGIGLGTIMVTGFGTLGVIMAKALNRSGF